jgi:hypothetical protein
MTVQGVKENWAARLRSLKSLGKRTPSRAIKCFYFPVSSGLLRTEMDFSVAKDCGPSLADAAKSNKCR